MENKKDTNWEEEYYNKKIVDFHKYLTSYDIELLKKLNLKIKNEFYTEYEYDILEESLYLYFISENDSQEVKNAKNNILKIKNLKNEEIFKIIQKFNKISKDYDF